jgi:putative DNA primase/helicase
MADKSISDAEAFRQATALIPTVDVDFVNAQALSVAKALLTQWTKGSLSGKTWTGHSDTARVGPREWIVDMPTGAWRSPDAPNGHGTGADLVTLYAAMFGVSDAIAVDLVHHEVQEHITRVNTAPKVLPQRAPRKPVVIESGRLEDSAPVSWQSLGLDMNQGGLPFPTLANASRILQIHPSVKGKIWYDTFQRKIWHTMRGEKREWEDSDAADLAVFVQQSMRLSKFTTNLIQDAVDHAARRAARNSLTDWLDALVWDNVERLDTWLSDALGIDRTPYTMAISSNWPISMVARAYAPGCQVDTMPVLEGHMGRGKSSFLERLGGEWYGTITRAIGEPDFIQEIQGVWLVEIPDMTGFGRREHSQILATITVRVDRYRPSYGRRVENRPRACVLAATSETDDYLTDTRGRRRFWPLRCTEIDLGNLSDNREQIFAEAAAKYRAGALWHEMPGETDDEQLERMHEDLWTERVLDHVSELLPQLSGGVAKVIAIPAHILKNGLDIELKDQTPADKLRIAGILQRAGWIPGKHKQSRCWIKPIRKPKP